MNAKTVISAKGQVVIPKDVRDQLGLRPGQQLDVIKTAGGVLLRPTYRKSGRTMEEVKASVREIVSKYDLPKLSIEELDEAIEGASEDAARHATL